MPKLKREIIVVHRDGTTWGILGLCTKGSSYRGFSRASMTRLPAKSLATSQAVVSEATAILSMQVFIPGTYEL